MLIAAPPLWTKSAEEETGFTPADLFGASDDGFYFSARLSNLWQDTAGTSAVTADGQPVRRIDDLSGNGNNGTESTSPPEYETSAGIVDFRPKSVLFVNEGWQLPSDLGASGSQNRSFFCVGGGAALANAQRAIFGLNNGNTSTNFVSWRFRTDTSDNLRIEIQGGGYSSSLAVSNDTAHIMGCVLDGTTIADHTLHLDGSTETATGTATVNTTSADNKIGFHPSASVTSDGNFPEWFFINRALSSSEITDLKSYWSSLYGVSV